MIGIVHLTPGRVGGDLHDDPTVLQNNGQTHKLINTRLQRKLGMARESWWLEGWWQDRRLCFGNAFCIRGFPPVAGASRGKGVKQHLRHVHNAPKLDEDSRGACAQVVEHCYSPIIALAGQKDQTVQQEYTAQDERYAVKNVGNSRWGLPLLAERRPERVMFFPAQLLDTHDPKDTTQDVVRGQSKHPVPFKLEIIIGPFVEACHELADNPPLYTAFLGLALLEWLEREAQLKKVN